MRYDLAIIGGGPAGYSAALEGARLGLTVILFEGREMGGTCLNRGCVPTKFLAHAAHVYAQTCHGERYGVSARDVQLNYASVCEERESVVDELRQGLARLLKQKMIIVQGCASLFGDRKIACAGEYYEADNILIATGSVPAKPIAEGMLTSDGLLTLQKIPGSLKIIGGGVNAVEFAYIFNSFGSKVEIAIRGKRILRKWDREISAGIAYFLRRKGIEIRTDCSAEQLCKSEAEVTLSATGRLPCLHGLDASLFDLGESGGIVTDAFGRTKTPGVYAAGDVVDNSPQLAHIGMEQGRRAVQCMTGTVPGQMPAVVRCIYTEPEAAAVGLSEAEAKESGLDAVSAKVNLHANARTRISAEERCFMKLTAQRDTHRLLGAQLFCERAGDLAGELALALNERLTVERLCYSLRPHPSYCEGITDAAEALRDKLL